MAEVQRPETMTSLVMENKYDAAVDCKTSSTYPEVHLRNKSTSDNSETQRKKRSKNRLSNRRSTGFVFEEDIEAALKMGANGENKERTN